MASFFYLSFLIFFLHLETLLYALDSCEPEGSIQLALNTTREFRDQTYHLLQVCLFGHWSYVCSRGFSKSDKAIALYQLGCTKGVTRTEFEVNSSLPVYLTSIDCLGVERRLVECHHGQLNDITNCNNKLVGVYCTEYGIFMCQNGELQKDNTSNALYICINGRWKTLCYNEYLWGPTQATIACRELNPGKMVTNASVTGLGGITTSPSILNRNFYCTGDEARLRDCVISDVNSKICGNKRVGLMCETGASPVNTTPVSYTSPLPGSHITPVSCSQTSPAAHSDTLLVFPLPWVGGGIIGAVLSAAILLTMLAAVCLLRRRRRRRRKTHSQHKITKAAPANTDYSDSTDVTNKNHVCNSVTTAEELYCIPDHTHAESSLIVSQNISHALHSQLTTASSESCHYELPSTLQDEQTDIKLQQNECYAASSMQRNNTYSSLYW